MPRIYSAPSYAMGALEVQQAANAPVTTQQAAKAKAELAAMRRTLTSWLKYRRINDQVASGQPVKPALLRAPGSIAAPAAVVRLNLQRERPASEQSLALLLHQLLSEVFDPQQLPNPSSPNAAVLLAQIAISGKLPGEAPAPSPTGMIWLWPAVIVASGIVLVIATKIRSDAEVARDREKYECIKSGACTDTGFWLKVGAVGLTAWLAWDKLGLREATQRLRKRAGGGRR